MVQLQDLQVMVIFFKNQTIQPQQLMQKYRLIMELDHYHLSVSKETLDLLQVQNGMVMMR